MKISVSRKNQEVKVLQSAVPEYEVLFSACFGNEEVMVIVTRELKKQYKQFLNYAKRIGLVATDRAALYPDKFYPTNIPLFEKNIDNLENMITNDGDRLFKLHNAMFQQKSHGQVIAAKRKKLGMTQAEAAKNLGIGSVQLSFIEQGMAFNATTIKKICEAFEVEFVFPRDVKLFERKR